MKCALHLFILLLVAGSKSFGLEAQVDPGHKPVKQNQSFAEFAVKLINPQNTDYGCKFDQARKIVVHETVQMIDFWTALVASSFLLLSCLLLLHQHNENRRREVIAAQLLSQYHNAWLDARTQVTEATQRYNELAERSNSATEAALRARLPNAEAVEPRPIGSESTQSLHSKVGATADIGNSAKSGIGEMSSHPSNRDLKASIHESREPKVDLMSQIRTLQQQLSASHEREKNLQRQLSKAVPQPQSEASRL